MENPIAVSAKKRGRPATGVDPMLNFRCPPDLTARIDAWIAAQPAPRPSRSEAIRRILDGALAGAIDAGSIATEELNASNDQ